MHRSLVHFSIVICLVSSQASLASEQTDLVEGVVLLLTGKDGSAHNFRGETKYIEQSLKGHPTKAHTSETSVSLVDRNQCLFLRHSSTAFDATSLNQIQIYGTQETFRFSLVSGDVLEEGCCELKPNSSQCRKKLIFRGNKAFCRRTFSKNINNGVLASDIESANICSDEIVIVYGNQMIVDRVKKFAQTMATKFCKIEEDSPF